MVGTMVNFIHTFKRNPHIFHFIGHGINDAGNHSIILEQTDGLGLELDTKNLKNLLSVCGASLKIVFLSACHSEGLS